MHLMVARALMGFGSARELYVCGGLQQWVGDLQVVILYD